MFSFNVWWGIKHQSYCTHFFRFIPRNLSSFVASVTSMVLHPIAVYLLIMVRKNDLHDQCFIESMTQKERKVHLYLFFDIKRNTGLKLLLFFSSNCFLIRESGSYSISYQYPIVDMWHLVRIIIIISFCVRDQLDQDLKGLNLKCSFLKFLKNLNSLAILDMLRIYTACPVQVHDLYFTVVVEEEKWVASNSLLSCPAAGRHKGFDSMSHVRVLFRR